MWWFDMFGGWFDDPAMLDIIEKSNLLFDKQSEGLLGTEVALVVDEHGHKYSSYDKEMMSVFLEAIDEIDKAGFPYDTYLLSDLSSENFPRDKYKLIIFLASTNPSPDTVEAISRKLKNSNRVLLFLGNSCAYADELTEVKTGLSSSALPKTAAFRGVEYPKKPIPSPEIEAHDGYVLSSFTDNTAAVVWNKRDGYHTVVSMHTAIPASLASHIALMAGVHLYNRTGDIVYAGGEFVAIRAMDDGYRRISLPVAGCKATDAISGKDVTVNDRFIDMLLEKGDTRILHIVAEDPYK